MSEIPLQLDHKSQQIIY